MLWNAFLLALREIRRNLMRSSLTSLGIVIGVAAVIRMVTLGRGATKKVKEQIASLGTNLLVVRPGQGFRGHGGVRGTAKSFDVKDAEAIEREIPGIEGVASGWQLAPLREKSSYNYIYTKSCTHGYCNGSRGSKSQTHRHGGL